MVDLKRVSLNRYEPSTFVLCRRWVLRPLCLKFDIKSRRHYSSTCHGIRDIALR